LSVTKKGKSASGVIDNPLYLDLFVFFYVHVFAFASKSVPGCV